jgi:hypothetical protein
MVCQNIDRVGPIDTAEYDNQLLQFEAAVSLRSKMAVGIPPRQFRASASGFGSGLDRIIETGFDLTPPFGDLLLEHSDQTTRLIELGTHAVEIRFYTIQLPGNRKFLILHTLLYDRDVLQLLRL